MPALSLDPIVNMTHANNKQRTEYQDTNMDHDHLIKLCKLDLEEKLKTSPLSFVTAEQLDSMPFVRGEEIDVDGNHCGSTNAAPFFQPSRPLDKDTREIFSQDWMELEEGQAPREYPEWSAGWFMKLWRELDSESDELEIDSFGGTAWRYMYDRFMVRGMTGLILPRGCILHYPVGSGFGYSYTHEYYSDIAFFPKDETKPHLACIICDTTISPDKSVLRSEVHGAVALIKHQLGNECSSNHHIKPVMLYTFQKDKYARITQVHYDHKASKIILRQSRQLEIGGPEPTKDVWLLMRWMLSTPVGDTLIKPEDGGLTVDTKEPAVSTLKSEEDGLSDDSKASTVSTIKSEDDGRSDKSNESAVSTLESDTKDWALRAREPEEDGPSIKTKDSAVSMAHICSSA
ncbi:hypothetical protein Daus18300_008036 [Diaporthe australafricana]|uniref:Uncharacterized protein n=1 Tax=Diaporthe australafricana TaxID=127596 RepID=A0ABR3WK64_9PEZI